MPKPMKIRLDGYGGGEVLLGGHDIASSIVGMTIEVVPGPGARDGVEVVLRLRPEFVNLEADSARVVVDEDTRRALETLGWSAPAVEAGVDGA
jgi:hypothetical protein